MSPVAPNDLSYSGTRRRSTLRCQLGLVYQQLAIDSEFLEIWRSVSNTDPEGRRTDTINLVISSSCTLGHFGLCALLNGIGGYLMRVVGSVPLGLWITRLS